MSQRHVPNTVVFKQLASLRKLEELAMKFEQAQIRRKLAQATASWRSNEVQAFSFDKGLTVMFRTGVKVRVIVECISHS